MGKIKVVKFNYTNEQIEKIKKGASLLTFGLVNESELNAFKESETLYIDTNCIIAVGEVDKQTDENMPSTFPIYFAGKTDEKIARWNILAEYYDELLKEWMK
jgi:hypothetical protein